MRQKRPCIALLLAIFSLCMFVIAENSLMSFTGSYSIRNVVNQGKTMQVTMNFRLFNASNADIKNATIILSDHMPALPPKGGPAAAGPMMPVNNHGTAKIAIARTHRDLELKNITFNVPAFEYQQWQRGAHPVFVVSYLAANGRPMQMPVELTRVP